MRKIKCRKRKRLAEAVKAAIVTDKELNVAEDMDIGHADATIAREANMVRSELLVDGSEIKMFDAQAWTAVEAAVVAAEAVVALAEAEVASGPCFGAVQAVVSEEDAETVAVDVPVVESVEVAKFVAIDGARLQGLRDKILLMHMEDCPLHHGSCQCEQRVLESLRAALGL